YTYVWDFGDGSPKAVGPIVTHAYAAGRFTPSVTVLDGSGASHTTLLPIITVENQPVTVLSSPPYFAIGLTTAIIVGIGVAVGMMVRRRRRRKSWASRRREGPRQAREQQAGRRPVPWARNAGSQSSTATCTRM